MEAKKSKVYSVRFDNEKLSFLQSMVKELVSGQQIVDYLLNKYWWDNKVPFVSAKEAPPLRLKEETVTPKSIIDIWDKPKQQPTFKSVADYSAEKKELETEEDYNKWLAALKADPNISSKQKDLLIKYN